MADPASVVGEAYSFLDVDSAFVPSPDAAARNTSAGKREPGRMLRSAGSVRLGGRRRILARLRTSGVGRWLATGRSRQALESILTRTIHRPEWDQDSRTFALDRLGDEPARTLELVGKGPGFWKLE